YAPTFSALNYFYPKLAKGGVILIHDYNHTWAGLRQAVDEFAATIPEVPVEIADWQGSVMIIKNVT
ncbi:MAG: TylF/MycF/NovP-related O-methyltransferase, partial [Cyclobacteriaceae bacterium]